MITIVKKDELLERIRANRATHRQIFEEAIEGYRTAAVQALNEKIDEVKSGRIVSILVKLPVPEDHTDEYDRVIDMLEMDQRDEIELDEYTFAQYVRDDWGWKDHFVTTNSRYSATAAGMS